MVAAGAHGSYKRTNLPRSFPPPQRGVQVRSDSRHGHSSSSPPPLPTVASGVQPSPAVPDPRVGQHLGKYRLAARLGSGGMGVVYLAEDTRLQRHVAIKLLSAAPPQDPQALHPLPPEAPAPPPLN